MRVLAIALSIVLAGCATQTVIVQPTQPRAEPVAVVPATVVFPVATTTKVKVKKVYVVAPGRKYRKGNICVYVLPDGTLTFTDRCRAF